MDDVEMIAAANLAARLERADTDRETMALIHANALQENIEGGGDEAVGLVPSGGEQTPARRLFEPGPSSQATNLLKNTGVLAWLKGESDFETFLVDTNRLSIHQRTRGQTGTPTPAKMKTTAEKTWGQATLQAAFPLDQHAETMWTGKLGEAIVKEHFPNGKMPDRREKMQPDWETDTHIFEVKTETYFTQGTAGEKILGVPIKYRKVPNLYKKPLQILCLAGAEDIVRHYELGSDNPQCDQIKSVVDLWASWGITYVLGSQLLKEHMDAIPASS
jgi:hypothetical protein